MAAKRERLYFLKGVSGVDRFPKKKGGTERFPLNLQMSNGYVDHSHKLMVKI